MSYVFRSPLARYGLGVALVGVALLLNAALWSAIRLNPAVLLLCAVLTTAWFAGLRPGIVTGVIATFAAEWWLYPGSAGWTPAPEALFRATVFLIVALLAGKLCSVRVVMGEQREWDRVVLSSIGDAVIATDTRGRITFMNHTAREVTRWSEDQAQDRPLDEVFNIVNEETRARVESPVTKVLRTGAVAGLANHTVLIARDGTEIPIDDSGAPIKRDDGTVIGVVLVFHDVVERRRAEEALRESNRRIVNILESMTDAFIALDREWRFTYLNHQAEEMLRRPRERLLGRNIWDEFPESIGSIFFDHYQRAVAEQVALKFEGLHGATGAWLEVHAYPSPHGLSIYFHDVTARRRAEEDRAQLLTREQAARSEAESANRMKDEFLATLSHELRTPLNAMLGWTRLLRGGDLDEPMQTRALEVIERNIRLQVQLVEDLLDISRIITGNLHLDIRTVDLPPVLDAAVDAIRLAAVAKEVHLDVSLDPVAGPVLADPDRLQQVIWNLLTNAVKFTPRGGRVDVRVARESSRVDIVVRDTGIGIAPELLPHVFERFRQGESSITRSHGGLGLGLAIVRHLVELHGGSVRAESPGEGLGATFTVSLPITALVASKETDQLYTVARGEQPTAFPTLAGARVLVVDDERDARELITTIFEHCDAQVMTAASASEALAVLDRWPADVLVSDIGLPGEDGYSLIRRVRARPPEHGGRIPALALTAYASSTDARLASEAGYQRHLTKPADPHELCARVAELLGG